VKTVNGQMPVIKKTESLKVISTRQEGQISRAQQTKIRRVKRVLKMTAEMN